MSRLSGLPLRVRLVAGFSAAMLVVLAAAGSFVYWRVQYALDRALDGDLDRAAATIAPLVGADGRVRTSGVRTAEATGATWQVLAADGSVSDGSVGDGAAGDGGGTGAGRALVPLSRLGETADRTVIDVGGLLPGGSEPYRVHLSPVPALDGATLLVAQRRDRRDEALRELLAQLVLAGLGALVVTAFVGDRLAHAALRPVEAYRRRAQDIARGASRVRLEVPVGRDDEVTRLGHTLNEVLAVQERALERERRFVLEASHELRTPLTLLRTRIQLTRRRERAPVELEGALDELLVDVESLSDLADHLLALGTAQDGAAPAVAGPGAVPGCDAVSVVRDVVSRAATSSDVDLVLGPGVGDGVLVGLARADLDRVVANLVANAVLHGAAPVRVGLERQEGWLLVTVRDAGPGMSPDLLAAAVQRFARADEARSRPGAGLGLALVEQVAAQRGGELRLCSRGHHVSHPLPAPVRCHHGDETTATLVLPLVTPTVDGADPGSGPAAGG